MINDDERFKALSILETESIRQYFLALYARGAHSSWFFCAPRTYEEKAQLDHLVAAGLIEIDTGEFRCDLEGHVKSSEFICKFTDLAEQVVASLL